jgi:hypothetical protein
MGTLSGGNASFSTTSLAAGVHNITATYSGDTFNAASTSMVVTVTVTVASTGTPEYVLSVSNSDITVTRGQIANLMVTLSPQNGFNSPVNLTCSGMPAGTSCTLSPATITPNGTPVSSTVSISAASSADAALNKTPQDGYHGKLALGLVMPWGILSLFGLSKRTKRSPIATWSIRIAMAAVLAGGALWMSGCGYTTNSDRFTMTLTSAGANVPTHSSQVTVSIMP